MDRVGLRIALVFTAPLSALLLSGCLVGVRGEVPMGPPEERGERPPMAAPGAQGSPALRGHAAATDADDGDDDVPPPEALPPSHPLDAAAAERALEPYGRWVDTPEYGRVWIPANVASDWQPYTDGRWVYTAWGWSFVADLAWGGIPYHYGRWGFGLELGWYWVPGFVWGPAWVSWRFADGFYCWSALGPRGYHYGRRWPGWVAMPTHAFGGSVRAHRVGDARPIVRASRVARAGIHGGGFGGSRGGSWSGGRSGTSGGGARIGGTHSSGGGGTHSSGGGGTHSGGGAHAHGGHK